MKHILAMTLVFLGTTTAMAAEPEAPDRVDPLLDCSAPARCGLTGKGKAASSAVWRRRARPRVRETYASRLAGLFWDQKEGEESRLVLRLIGDEPVETRKLTICGEPLTVGFISGQIHTGEELRKLHADNLEWFRGKFPGLQGTYADERTGEIVLEIYARKPRKRMSRL